MPALLLVLLFIGVPIVELAVIIQVGQAIGVLPTIVLLIGASILGGVLLRSQGRIAWRRLNEAIAAGRVPHNEVVDGALILLGGALLLTPGFLSDFLGLGLLAPPTRALARRVVTRLVARRALVGIVGLGGRGGFAGRARTRRNYDVEGSASEAEEPAERPASGRSLADGSRETRLDR